MEDLGELLIARLGEVGKAAQDKMVHVTKLEQFSIGVVIQEI